MQALGVTTRQALWNYSKGAYRLDVEVAAKIEQIFLKYDVKNPWGDTPLKS